MSQVLYHQSVRSMMANQTIGAFLQGLQIVVIDGTTFDVPDSDGMLEYLVVLVRALVSKLHFPLLIFQTAMRLPFSGFSVHSEA